MQTARDPTTRPFLGALVVAVTVVAPMLSSPKVAMASCAEGPSLEAMARNGVGTAGSGTIGFRTGRRYVVVGQQNADGTYQANVCGGSGPISKEVAHRLIRLAGGADATRPTSNGNGSTLSIVLAFLAGAALSTAFLLARRRNRRKSDPN